MYGTTSFCVQLYETGAGSKISLGNFDYRPVIDISSLLFGLEGDLAAACVSEPMKDGKTTLHSSFKDICKNLLSYHLVSKQKFKSTEQKKLNFKDVKILMTSL